MEQEHFYITVIDDSDKQEIIVKSERLSELFYPQTVSKLLDLTNNKTLHFTSNVSVDSQCHGCFLSVYDIKTMALLDMSFSLQAKLNNVFATNQLTQPDFSYAHFVIGSYTKTVDEISEFLGLQANNCSFNRGELTKSTRRAHTFTSWDFKSTLAETAPVVEHVAELVNTIYFYKENILALSNEVDIFSGVSVTGHMPNEYQFEISADTIRKLAEMRMSLDFDMYFKHS